jgi:hypothetical protein
MSYQKKIFLNILLFGFLFITCDFIATFAYNKIIIKEKKFETGVFGARHDSFHHHLKKNFDMTDIFNQKKYKIITNSLGFRDKKIRNIEYVSNGRRLIFIGDSFTFGPMLDYEDTFVGKIDKEMSANFHKFRINEVLNMGVPSYTPIIYYHKIKFFIDEGLEFSDLVVFIDISDIQNETNYYYNENTKNVVSFTEPNYYYIKIKHLIAQFLKDDFLVSYNILKFIYDFVSPKNKVKTYKNEDEYIKFITSKSHKIDKWTIDKDVYNEYAQGIKSALKYMKLLKSLCEKNNIKLTIAVYPWATQIYHKDLESKQVSIWKNFSETNNVNFINLFPIFINLKDDENDIMKKIKKYYIPYDVHFNKNANELISNFFLKEY